MKSIVIFILSLGFAVTTFAQDTGIGVETDDPLSSSLFGTAESPRVRPPERDTLSDGADRDLSSTPAESGNANDNGDDDIKNLEQELAAIRNEIVELERQLSDVSVAIEVNDGTVGGAPLWLWDLSKF